MTSKLLAIDLDGTLLRRDGTIHADDVAALLQLRGAGVPVSIVTGRLYSGSLPAARAIGIEGPIACVEGSQIVDTRGHRTLVHSGLSGEPAATLRQLLERRGVAIFLFHDETIFHDAAGIPFTRHLRIWSPNLSEVERVAIHPSWEADVGLLAVIAVGKREEILEAAEEVSVRLGQEASVAAFPMGGGAGTFAMMVRAAGATKGKAVEWLARHYGCAPSEVVVVGDWVNDLTMFAAAGRSFVMSHAPAPVKAAATDQLTADQTTGGGIAEAIGIVWGA